MIIQLPKARGNASEDDQPMTLAELDAIWQALPEERRFSFVLSLNEQIADRLIEFIWRHVVSTENLL
jgi:hypothetical protein